MLPLPIFNASLGRREKLPQKVGRKEKLAEKVGRRESYPPVPPSSHREERTLNLGESVGIEKKIRAAGSCCMDQSSYFKCLFQQARKSKQSRYFWTRTVRILGYDSQD